MPNLRPNLLKRAQSSTTRQVSNLLHSRNNSPHPQPDTVSGLKPIEEETLPKYNAESFYPARLGETLNDRYKLLVKLGFGMTATVWLAQDLRADKNAGNRKYVTIKINVNNLSEEFLKGRREIAQRLQTANPSHPGYNHVRFMLDTFKVKSRGGEHLCIVYDVLREPVDMCMEKFPGRRFNSDKLRKLLPALLLGLDYMHSEAHVVHTDLKADNIMMGLGDPSVLDRFVQHELEHPSPRKMPDNHGRIIYTSCSDFGEAPSDAVIESAKITDIGLAQWGDVKNTKPIQSNAFMAPEVILQCGWSYPADIWNLAVMLWDLFENFGLFDGIDTRPGHYRPEQHLGLMIALLGPPPPEFLKRGAKTSNYFDSQGNFKYPDYIAKDLTFESSIARFRGEEKELFIDFAQKMLKWVPEERWTAKQLLEHPYLTKEREYVPTPALSRASTETFNSGLPSRSGTPGPTSHPLLPPPLMQYSKNSEKPSPRISPPDANGAKLEKSMSIPTPSDPIPMPFHLKKRDTALSDSAARSPTSKPVPQSNKCSQELIDSILNRGKPNAHKPAETKPEEKPATEGSP